MIRIFWFYDVAEIISHISGYFITLPHNLAKAIKIGLTASDEELLSIFCSENSININRVKVILQKLGVTNRVKLSQKDFFLPITAYKQDRQRFFPATVVISTTLSCNFRCSYCSSTLFDKCFLRREDVFRLCDELADNYCHKVVIGGGEPFLDPYLFDYLDAFLSSGIFPYVSTNGSLLKKKNLKRLAKSKLRFLQVSLDTLNQDIFEELSSSKVRVSDIIEAISILCQEGFYITIRTVLTRQNLIGLRNLTEKISNIGVSEHVISFPSRMNPVLRGRNDLIFYKHEMEEIEREYSTQFSIKVHCPEKPWQKPKDIVRCGALSNSLIVRATGEIIACDFVPKWQIGHFSKDSISNAWVSQQADMIRKEITTNIYQLSQQCVSCPLKIQCRGGCTALKLSQGLTTQDADPRCFLKFNS